MKRPYSTYIILSTYRSGTNYLTCLLNSHPMIVSHHECFRTKYFPHPLDPRRLYRSILPVRFMNSHIYGQYPGIVRAVGFELQYDQAQSGRTNEIWNHIRSSRDIKIIHLKRLNLLKTYLSWRIATVTNTWTTTDPGPKPQTVIDIDPATLKTYFLDIETYRRRYDAMFARHRSLQITYETLTSRASSVHPKILTFLGVPKLPLTCVLKKQNTRTLRECIRNYDTLKSQFSNTRWQAFFED